MLSIVLTLLGIVAIVVFTTQVYKTAIDTERNASGWAVVTAAVRITIQFVLPLLVGILVGIYLVVTGNGLEHLETSLFGLLTIIDVLGVILSVVGMWFVMKHVSKIKEADAAGPTPPPPPTFSENV